MSDEEKLDELIEEAANTGRRVIKAASGREYREEEAWAVKRIVRALLPLDKWGQGRVFRTVGNLLQAEEQTPGVLQAIAKAPRAHGETDESQNQKAGCQGSGE